MIPGQKESVLIWAKWIYFALLTGITEDCDDIEYFEQLVKTQRLDKEVPEYKLSDIDKAKCFEHLDSDGTLGQDGLKRSRND